MAEVLDFEKLEEHVKDMQHIEDNSVKQALKGLDDKTTLSANKKLDSAYDKSQSLLDMYKKNLATDANNIKQIGVEFKKIDSL